MRSWHRKNGRLAGDGDRDGNDPDPGGTPPESEYEHDDDDDEADIGTDADMEFDGFDSMESALLMSAFGEDAFLHTSSSEGDMLVSAGAAVDPIPITNMARAALNDPVYGEKWRLAMQAEVQGKYQVNGAWPYIAELPEGRKMMKGRWIFSIKYNDEP